MKLTHHPRTRYPVDDCDQYVVESYPVGRRDPQQTMFDVVRVSDSRIIIRALIYRADAERAARSLERIHK